MAEKKAKAWVKRAWHWVVEMSQLNVRTWSQLRVFGSSRVVKSSYLWIVLLPALAHLVADIPPRITFEVLERALRIRETALGADSPLVAEVLEARARVRSVADEQGVADARRASAIRESAHDPRHPAIGEALATLGLRLIFTHDYEESLSTLERALAILEPANGPRDHRVGEALDAMNEMVDC